ncbi:hypothetical protein C8F01DRAFT_989837 [Mycena amicta]|nr:hypothetical protein C8F01DRAFT_989837 [Mycena amicta]
MALRVLILLFILAIDAAHAILTNITVDDTDTSVITYKGAWDPFASHQSTLDFGGSHAFSSDEGASATLGFSGVAVYYLAPRWPYAVSSRISLDGGEAVLVNLTDLRASPTPEGGSESAVWSVAWFADGLTQEPHEVVVSIGNYIIVDGFMCVLRSFWAGTDVGGSADVRSIMGRLRPRCLLLLLLRLPVLHLQAPAQSNHNPPAPHSRQAPPSLCPPSPLASPHPRLTPTTASRSGSPPASASQPSLPPASSSLPGFGAAASKGGTRSGQSHASMTKTRLRVCICGRGHGGFLVVVRGVCMGHLCRNCLGRA